MAQDAVDRIMARSKVEPYARLLGTELIELSPGHALVSMRFTPALQNIFGMLHGGAVFSLMDEALQAASNSYDEVTVAQQVSIYFIAAAGESARLVAEAQVTNRTRKTCLVEIHAWEVGDEWQVGQPYGRKLASATAQGYCIGGGLPIDDKGKLSSLSDKPSAPRA